jgi:hypothetical protein
MIEKPGATAVAPGHVHNDIVVFVDQAVPRCRGWFLAGRLHMTKDCI